MVAVVTAVRRDMPLDTLVQFVGHQTSPGMVRRNENLKMIIYPEEMFGNKTNVATGIESAMVVNAFLLEWLPYQHSLNTRPILSLADFVGPILKHDFYHAANSQQPAL